MVNATSWTTLRSRWNRAFAVLFTVLVLAASVNVVATRIVVGGLRATAEQAERGAELRAAVRTEMAAYSDLVHRVVDGEAVDQLRLDQAEASVGLAFARGLVESGEPTRSEALRRARDHWELVVAGPVDRGVDIDGPTHHRWLDTGTREVAELVARVGVAERATTAVDLARADDVERAAAIFRWGFGALLAALIVSFARRLSTDVLRPLALLRDSANALAAGQLDHRVVVDRQDEIGQLAVGFNAMAEAIAGNQRRLSRLAHQDSLTGLANRAAFYARLGGALSTPERRERSQAVLFIDLDDFKDVNDTLGHAAGDQLLRILAARLESVVRPGDLVARISGDEFALLLDGCAEPGIAMGVAARAVVALSEPVELAGRWVGVGASVGVAIGRPGSDVASLMREADVAMYTAKGRGKNRVQRYDPAFNGAASEGVLAGSVAEHGSH